MQPQNDALPARIRHNITIKPSNRRQYTPEASTSTSKPPPNPTASTSRQAHSITPCSPADIPEFPPPDVILHKDDASSKVFLAIARSLLSVDNRATTVKDLADLAVNNGLGCQNSSAATQAITTYLRTHNDRCEADQDQPLLLSHSLSGTDADDDLIPALYSLQGGNPRKVSPTRRTNFRKNTAVWYLSRATGAPCPFARAGIRLCDYTTSVAEEGEDRSTTRRRSKHHDDHVAGQKRKRPQRSCVAKDSSDEDTTDNELDNRPQKKLTLRIRLNCPSLAASRRAEEQQSQNISGDESDTSSESVEMESCVDEELRPCSPDMEEEEEEEPWRLPPYPRRSISIPCYTPSYEGSYPPFPIATADLNPFRRSPSVAHSVGSLPPDSEDDDDFHISMTHTQDFSDEPTTDFDYESEDADTQFESPGPRSPSAPLIPPQFQVTVKEEPRDLQGMLDAWDDFDSSLTDIKAPTCEPMELKPESLETWDWSSRNHWEKSPSIKQEDLSFDSLFPDTALLSPLAPPAPSPSDSSPFHRITPLDEDWDLTSTPYATIRPRSKTEPALSPFHALVSPGPSSHSVPPPTHTNRDDSLSGTNTESPHTQPYSSSSTNLTPSIASLIHSMSSLYSSGVSPSSLVLGPTKRLAPAVVVHTCQPCDPPITATQIEDISVYQMSLGNFHFLRRIDTDFVKLSPIVTYLQAPFPVLGTVPNATIITKGSSAVVGVWVPLAVVQVYLKDHPAKDGEFDIFLSDELFERFPTALQDFHRSNEHARMLNQFGRHFDSTLQVTQAQQEQQVLSIVSAAEMLARQQEAASLPPAIAIPSSTVDAYALPAAMAVVERQHEETDVPLSATEKEIFDLCVVPDWDKDSAPSTATLPASAPEDDSMEKEKADEEVGGTDGDAGVSDTSPFSSPESICPSKPVLAAKAPSVQEVPAPPQASTSSSSHNIEEVNGGAGPTAMEGVVEVAACSDSAPSPVRVSCVEPTPAPAKEASGASRPLRRSKRVADKDTASHHAPGTPSAAHTARTRTRGGRGSRNSLS